MYNQNVIQVQPTGQIFLPKNIRTKFKGNLFAISIEGNNKIILNLMPSNKILLKKKINYPSTINMLKKLQVSIGKPINSVALIRKDRTK